MSGPYPQFRLPEIVDEAIENDVESNLTGLPAKKHGRRRSNTAVDFDRSRLQVQGMLPAIQGWPTNLRRSISHMRLGRLQVSIPFSNNTQASSTTPVSPEVYTPQTSESSPELETPATLGSPIAGVVDLTKSVTTTSPYAVAHGGLSDIYLGEWRRMDEDLAEVPGAKRIVVVIINSVLPWYLSSSHVRFSFRLPSNCFGFSLRRTMMMFDHGR